VVTAFIFRVRNVSAALFKALSGFATNSVNMTKLESYQTGGQFFASQFYAEIDGHPKKSMWRWPWKSLSSSQPSCASWAPSPRILTGPTSWSLKKTGRCAHHRGYDNGHPDLGKIVLTVGDWSPEGWIAHLEQHVPREDIFSAMASPPPAEVCAQVKYAVAWHTPDGFFANFPNLECVLSTGAGVDHLVGRPDLARMWRSSVSSIRI
jgi:hypothetical protein